MLEPEVAQVGEVSDLQTVQPLDLPSRAGGLRPLAATAPSMCFLQGHVPARQRDTCVRACVTCVRACLPARMHARVPSEERREQASEQVRWD